MGEEPEEVLPKDGTTPSRDLGDLTAHHKPRRQEEAGVGQTIHQHEESGRFERREGEQQEKGRDKLCPDEEGQAHESHPIDAQLNGGHDKVDRAEE